MFLTNRKHSIFVLLLIVALFASACGGGGADRSGNNGTSDSSGAEPSGKQEKVTLRVINWKDYGSDDPELVGQFEELYNVKIEHQYMASEEELLTQLRIAKDGTIDLVLPNASILPAAIEEGLLQEIDVTQLSNYDSIYEPFKTLKENVKDGKVYAVPWVWGSTAIAYNPDKIQEPIRSIHALWDEKYKGRIAFRDDFNDAIMTAAIALGQDPNAPSDLDAIYNKLLEQKPLNRTYWKTGDEFSKLYAGDMVDIGLMWSGQTATMKQEGLSIRYVIPEEGAIGWVDNWAIPKGSKNSELAHKFIDFLISKEFQEAWVNKGGPAPVNQNVSTSLDPAFVEEMGLNEAAIEKLYFISYHTPEEKEKWNEIWQKVKAQ